jgi:hypothetical protein
MIKKKLKFKKNIEWNAYFEFDSFTRFKAD